MNQQSAPLVDVQLAQQVLAQLGVAVAQVDASLTLVAHTSDLASYFHLPETDLVGEPLTDLFPELVGCEIDLLAVARGDLARFDLPKINRPHPSSEGRCYISLTALPHPQLERHLTLLVRDVCAEGQLEQQVIQQLNELRLLRRQLETVNQELVRLDEEKSAFLQIAAHDLRAPLTVIKGYVDLILSRYRDRLGKRVIDYLLIVQDHVAAMARLIGHAFSHKVVDEVSAHLETYRKKKK